MDRIKRLRWQQRSLSEDTKQNLSQAEIEVRPDVFQPLLQASLY